VVAAHTTAPRPHSSHSSSATPRKSTSTRTKRRRQEGQPSTRQQQQQRVVVVGLLVGKRRMKSPLRLVGHWQMEHQTAKMKQRQRQQQQMRVVEGVAVMQLEGVCSSGWMTPCLGRSTQRASLTTPRTSCGLAALSGMCFLEQQGCFFLESNLHKPRDESLVAFAECATLTLVGTLGAQHGVFVICDAAARATTVDPALVRHVCCKSFTLCHKSTTYAATRGNAAKA